MNRGWWPELNGLRRLMRPQHLSHFTIEGWHCFRAIAPNLGVAIRLEAHSFAIVAMPPLDGPRLSEASPLHATLNCGYRHHGCMCRSCVSQLIRRNPFLRQYVASLTGRMLMVAGCLSGLAQFEIRPLDRVPGFDYHAAHRNYASPSRGWTGLLRLLPAGRFAVFKQSTFVMALFRGVPKASNHLK